METFIAKCGRWIDIPGKMMKNKEDIRFLIKLHRNSLFYGYFLVIIDSKVEAIFPITKDINVIISDSQIAISQDGDQKYSLTFLFESTFVANLVYTQIKLCSSFASSSYLNTIKYNKDFIEKYSEPIHIVDSELPALPILPFSYFEESMKTWINRNSVQNSSFYYKKSRASITFLTWNVEQKEPEPWTSKEISFIFAKGSDVIYFALEEIDFSVYAIVFGDSERSEGWHKTLCQAAEWYNYEIITEDHLGGVFVIAFKKKESSFKIEGKNLFSKRLGINGMAANKSAVVTQLTIDDSTFAVVGAHLQAQTENVERRNEQIRSLVAMIDEYNYDYLVIFGDLNYRIEGKYQETVDMIKEGKFDELKEKDQLINAMKTDEVLSTFKEGEINFKPTFKFDDYQNVYDTSPKHRTPSWTDRVLVRTGKPRMWSGIKDEIYFETSAIANVCTQFSKTNLEGNLILHKEGPDYPSNPECTKYRSFDVQFSDHRPVISDYLFDIVTLDNKRKEEFKRIEEMHMNFINILSEAHVTCDKKEIHIAVGSKGEIVLKNSESSFCQWEPGVVPEGIKVLPEMGILTPGMETIVTIEVTKHFEEPQVCSIDISGGSPVFFELFTD